MGRVYGLGPGEQAVYPDKSFKTMQARVALLKGELKRRHDEESGDPYYLLTLAGWTRPMSSLDAVEEVVERAERCRR